MGKGSKGIRVKDKNGVPFVVFQREVIDTFHGQPRTLLRYELAGRVGDFVDGKTFVLMETGERFSVVPNGHGPVAQRPDRRLRNESQQH